MTKDKKIGAELWISDINGSGYVKLKKPVEGLLWAELVTLMSDYGNFKKKIEGTRFDKWLEKEKQNGPR